MARPSMLTAERKAKIVEMIHKGNFAYQAAQAAGINRQTLSNWLRKGERDIGEGKRSNYAKFTIEYEAAEAVAESKLVAIINGAASGESKKVGDWKAAAWLLERKNPKRWARRQVMNVIQEGIETTTRVDLTLLKSDDLRALKDLLKKAAHKNDPRIDKMRENSKGKGRRATTKEVH